MRHLNAEEALNLGKLVEHLGRECTYVQVGLRSVGENDLLITFKITKLSKAANYSYIGAVTPTDLQSIRDPKVIAEAFIERLRNKFNKPIM